MTEPSLDELLEACRPDRGDLALPEMEPLARRLADDESLRERLDEKSREDALLREAMEDVPVPTSLLARLERAVMLVESGDAARVRERSGDVVPRPLIVELPAARAATRGDAEATRKGRSRRFAASWLAAGLALGLIGAILGLSLDGWSGPRGPASAEELASAAVGWSDDLSERWESEPTDIATARPVAQGIRARQTGWQVKSTAYDPRTVVYSLHRDSAAALLFVAHAPAAFLGDRAPMRKLPSSGGVSVGAWKSGELLYVLVVRGDHARLEDFFAPVTPRVAAAGRVTKRSAV